MTNNRFRPQPQFGQNARAPAVDSDKSAVVEFKNTYVQERRILERLRGGSRAAEYKPAASLDGASNLLSPEASKTSNAWLEAYKKLKALQSFATPAQYVRILFSILRGSSLAVPTVRQLTTPLFLELVSEHLSRKEEEMRNEYVAETQRAKSAILINQKGVGYPLPLAVYYALVDRNVELSPLLKYCLAFTTAQQHNAKGVYSSYCEKLIKLAKQYEFMAALDYAVFPDLYDTVWGNAIPDNLRVTADSLKGSAVEQ